MAHVRVEVIQPEPPPRKVTLELTEEEAAVVCIVVGALETTGHYTDTVLGIYKALSSYFPTIKCGDFLDTYPRLRKTVPPLPRLQVPTRDAS